MSIKASDHLDEPYTHQAVVQALKNSLLDFVINETETTPEDETTAVQWLEYELINWDLVARHDSLANAYCIRKGLIPPRKYLEKGYSRDLAI
ncbi:hypothetical protein G6F68_020690 [Rhizopus microsporus]|nr:hypothetical protein G6F68_020690 [Rhizopus microsporus]